MWYIPSTIFNRRHALRTAGLITLCVALITTLFFGASTLAAPGINQTLSFSGRLMNSSGGIVADGHYNIQFKIYQDGTGAAAGNPGGTLKWTETHINNGGTSGIEVKNGYFSVNLGSSNPFGSSVDWNQDTLWLSMNVAGSSASCTSYGTAPCTADGEMLPMKRLTATPFALNAARIGGLTSSQLIQNTTTLQVGTNVALQSGADADITAYIQGRNSQTSANLVIKQGSSQTGKALEVQNSSGTSLFNIDATGTLNQTGGALISGNLGLGTVTSPGRQLDIALNTSSTNALPVRITQQGTGDAGIEMSTLGSSKYSIGIDASDGAFKIASSIAAGATSNLGTTTVGSTSNTGNTQRAQANKYTASQTGPVLNMSVYMNTVDSVCPNIQLGVYADNGSGTAPGALLGSSTASAATIGWNTKTLTSAVNITSGTVYWLSIYTTCDDTLAMTTGTGNRAIKSGAASLTNPFASDSVTTGQLSLYATIDTNSGVVDSFSGNGPLMSLGPTGDVTFRGAARSNSAFQIQNSSGNDLLSVNSKVASGTEHAGDGNVNDSTTFSTNWTSFGGAPVSRITSDGQEGSTSAQVIPGTVASAGIKNKLSINPLPNTTYRVSVYAKLTAGSAFTDFRIRYSPDQSSTFVTCTNYNTQTITTTGWTQITCDIATAATTVTAPYVYMVQPTAPASGRTYLVDTLSFTLASNYSSNIKVGTGVGDSDATLFTLDKAASAPTIVDKNELLGSMYYDTTLGKVQCYEADGWGACGAAPDNFVTISPEYTNAVMNGTDIGTITSDLCSDALNINDGTSGATICGTNETYNFYKWTSAEVANQTRSIYVTYQLPSTFKGFVAGSTSLLGRTDSTNSTVSYQVYKDHSGSALASCGTAVTVSTGVKTTWQKVAASGSADPSNCGFVAGDSILVRINLISKSSANAYVSTLGFTFSNN